MKKINSIFIYSIVLISLFSLLGCSVNKANIDNELKSYFDEKNVEGCFTLLDNATGKITVYNIGMDTIRYAPGASFDIFNALVALETGVVADEKAPILFDLPLVQDSSIQHMNLIEAFQKNSASATQFIAQKIGKTTMQLWIDSIGYGNKNIGDETTNFWQNNTLQISADEQLGFMKRLYFDQLPFRKSVQLSVRDMMSQINNSVYAINYKTATVKDKSNHLIQWVTGWIEENRHVYFFTTVLKSKKANINETVASISNLENSTAQQSEKLGVDITNNILTHYGFFKGKK